MTLKKGEPTRQNRPEQNCFLQYPSSLTCYTGFVLFIIYPYSILSTVFIYFYNFFILMDLSSWAQTYWKEIKVGLRIRTQNSAIILYDMSLVKHTICINQNSWKDSYSLKYDFKKWASFRYIQLQIVKWHILKYN